MFGITFPFSRAARVGNEVLRCLQSPAAPQFQRVDDGSGLEYRLQIGSRSVMARYTESPGIFFPNERVDVIIRDGDKSHHVSGKRAWQIFNLLHRRGLAEAE